MTTAAKARTLSWDSFLPEQEIVRNAIDAFRKTEWLSIKRQLALEFPSADISYEPHWAAPGQVVYWQEQFKHSPRKYTDRAGRDRMAYDQYSNGWTSTNPLPAGTASVIAHYLKKGLRLRPPADQGYVEVSEAAAPTEESGTTTQAQSFECNRHGKDRVVFPTWRGYIQHCAEYGEMPENTPDEVMEKRKQFMWYCPIHDKGFNHKNLAARHVKAELRKPSTRAHPSVTALEVHNG
jgi:hypothetical protein